MEQAEVRTLPLPVKLTEKELALRAQELATAEGELTDHERALEAQIESAKEQKKKHENDVADSRATVQRLARVVRDRAETRDVPIMDEADYDAGAMNTYRTDTHELVTTRGLTEAERQQSLFNSKAKKRQPS